MEQPKLFEGLAPAQSRDTETLTLFALGEFQARKKVLADRPLALDRLRGAFRRAAEHYNCAVLSDEQIVAALRALDAQIERRPSFVAKHPYRVKVGTDTARRAQEFYTQLTAEDTAVVKT